jgi:cobalt-zinc-cadmium efflux system membrane fusion protein
MSFPAAFNRAGYLRADLRTADLIAVDPIGTKEADDSASALLLISKFVTPFQVRFTAGGKTMNPTTHETVTQSSTANNLQQAAPGRETQSRNPCRSRLSMVVPNLWIVTRYVARAIPTIAVLAALAAVAYWGHHSGWKVPKLSQLAADGSPKTEDWCAEHGVPESICVACNAALMPKGQLYGWCKVHGVAECVLENPGLAQLSQTPAISLADLQRARRALETKDRPKNDPLCKLHLRRIQFASRQAADKAGIDIALVERGRIVETIEASGEIQYDPTRLARLSSRAAGTVWRVEKNMGDSVRQGDVLALVDSVSVGQAKAELLHAVARLQLHDKTFKRLAGLEAVIAGRRLQETEADRAQAEADVRKAVQTLSNLGLPITLNDLREKQDDELSQDLLFLGLPGALAATLDRGHTSANLLAVVAPRDGLVVTRDVVAGEVIDSAKTLFTVVDASRMWLLLDVPLEDARYIQTGQQVIFRPDGDSHDHEGRVTWISTDVDSETRTVKVRAELSNDDLHLRNESFGAGQIVLRDEPDAIVAPKDAVHWEGCCHVAFVRDKDFLKEGSYKIFHTRMVRPGVTNGGYTELIAGLLPGEVIVTQGSGLLRAELLKGNLGAG